MANTAELAISIARLDDRAAALEAQVEQIKKERQNLSQLFMDQLDFEKVESIVVDVDGSPRRVGLHEQFWAKKNDESVSSEDVYDALIAVGCDELATKTYNTQSLSAWMRERFRENKEYELPPELAALIGFKKVTQVRVTRK